MDDSGIDAAATLDAWRRQGMDRSDPLRFHHVEALHRRAATHDGAARRLLESRLAGLVKRYAGDVERAASGMDAGGATAPATPGHGAIAALTARLASQAATRGGAPAAGAPRSFPELDALADFRRIWSEVLGRSQARQSLAQASPNAGPLNSGKLVHRALTLMREQSPDYLRQFLSYVDTLSWLERMGGGDVPADREKPRAGGGGKRAPDKPRSRRRTPPA